MFNGKKKAVTFSFDDGVTQDRRIIEIFDKYNLKVTFNINSELLGKSGELLINGKHINHNKVNPNEVRELYKNHEVAVHTLTHPRLTELFDPEVIRQVEQDRLNLSELVGYEVLGMAYPCGGENFDERVKELVKNSTGVKYSRTIIPTKSFDLQDELCAFNPTIHYYDMDGLEELGQKFVELETDKPQIFYIWGHAYELDALDGWERFEEFCKFISNRDDIFYGTNREVLL